ncbi:MAG: hypothetical protein CMC70_01260 [Flavobacteriaceae bacterium]|nr:hypothetical protein [Flavobacteriaceae bacterium]
MKKIFYLLPLLFVFSFISCEDEPVNTVEINRDMVDEELFNYLKLITNEPSDISINCIEFNYFFTVFSFDENQNLINTQAVFNNDEFVAFLDALPETHSISVNYPISGTLSNGELIEVNTNEELKNAIKNCSKEEQQRQCNNTLVSCIMKVNPVPGSPNDFEGATYKINGNGTLQFYYENKVYFGTWVTLYIGEELFLNIDLNDDTQIEDFWDHNWKIGVFTDTQIFMSNDVNSVLIENDCSISCNEEGYQVCELDSMPEVATFNLQKYNPCIAIPATHDVISSITYSFYVSEEDALANTNALNPTNYNNVENPQIIFVRIDYSTTGDLIETTTITLEAIPCTGG